MILLCSDYGLEGPYIGQVEAAIYRHAPMTRVINLCADFPRGNIRAAAALLAASTVEFPEGTVFFCVVDPGVGTFTSPPVILEINRRWYVGPDNGIFDQIGGRAGCTECLEITWRPEHLSRSFHGRDLYAPVCAWLARGRQPETRRIAWKRVQASGDELPEIIYIDHFGNAFTGIRYIVVPQDSILHCGNRDAIRYAGTFAEAHRGEVFWYGNSIGLVEIAANQERAAELLGIHIGSSVGFSRGIPEA